MPLVTECEERAKRAPPRKFQRKEGKKEGWGKYASRCVGLGIHVSLDLRPDFGSVHRVANASERTADMFAFAERTEPRLMLLKQRCVSILRQERT